MAGRILFEGAGPMSQETQAVEALSAYLNKPIVDGALNLGNVVLVQNSKQSGYYAVTAKDCSCPSKGYRPGHTCKHMRKYFGARDEPFAPIGLVDKAGFRPCLAGE
ncbi:MAG TPA: hypothetical protein VN455_00550 [Methanotrichaceae archaeon]|nr:hypothetical protein [Methanotrichaceae archaeon]